VDFGYSGQVAGKDTLRRMVVYCIFTIERFSGGVISRRLCYYALHWMQSWYWEVGMDVWMAERKGGTIAAFGKAVWEALSSIIVV